MDRKLIEHNRKKEEKRQELLEQFDGLDDCDEYIESIMLAWDNTFNMTDLEKLKCLIDLEKQGVQVFGYWFWDEEEYDALIEKEGYQCKHVFTVEQRDDLNLKAAPYWG